MGNTYPKSNSERLGKIFQTPSIHNGPALILDQYRGQSRLAQAALKTQEKPLRALQDFMTTGLQLLTDRPAHRFRGQTPMRFLLNYDFDYPVWQNGAYRADCWYELDKLKLQPTIKEIQRKTFYTIRIESLAGHWLMTAEDRQRRFEQLGLDTLPVSFLHALQRSKAQETPTGYSSSIGLL